MFVNLFHLTKRYYIRRNYSCDDKHILDMIGGQFVSPFLSPNYRENNILEKRHFNIKDDDDVCAGVYACAITGGERERAGPMIPVDPGPRTLAPGPPMCR